MRTKYAGVYGEIDSLPGCSQVAVSHSVFVPEPLRGKGAATEANRRRCVHLKVDYGYDYTLCTVDLSNRAQLVVLAKNGWKQLDSFRSTKTGHLVGLFGKQL